MLLQGRSPGKRAANQAARRQASAAAAAQGDRPASASAGGFWPTISGADGDALAGPEYDMDGAGCAPRVMSLACLCPHLRLGLQHTMRTVCLRLRSCDKHCVHPKSATRLVMKHTGCCKQGQRLRRRRKPQPEKPPPMMSPIKSLFASTRLGHLGGMMLPSLGSSPASASLLQPGAPAKLGAPRGTSHGHLPKCLSHAGKYLTGVKPCWRLCRGGGRDWGAHDGSRGGAAALPVGAHPALGDRRVLLLCHRPPLLHALRVAGAMRSHIPTTAQLQHHLQCQVLRTVGLQVFMLE